MKLTKSAIDGLHPTTKDRFLWDKELPGFGVRCNPYGRKTFVLRYRTTTGKQRMQLVGRCCDLSISQAREVARGIVGQVRSGSDPMAERVRLQGELTLGMLWDRYLNGHVKAYNKPATVETYRHLWNKRLQPWANRKLSEISRSDVLNLHASMCRNPIPANRTVALLSKMFNMACEWELLPPSTNPARRIKKYPERIRERVLSSDEVRKLWHACDHSDTPPEIGLLTKLLLLTGCRLGEIRKAETRWVDFEQGLLLLPDSKVGQRPVALSDAALSLLEGCHSRKYIIPGRYQGTPAKSVHARFRALCKRAGLEGVTPHVLRHTVGSHAHKAGMSQREIADLLGHRQLVTTQRYMHGFGSERRHNANRVANLWA